MTEILNCVVDHLEKYFLKVTTNTAVVIPHASIVPTISINSNVELVVNMSQEPKDAATTKSMTTKITKSDAALTRHTTGKTVYVVEEKLSPKKAPKVIAVVTKHIMEKLNFVVLTKWYPSQALLTPHAVKMSHLIVQRMCAAMVKWWGLLVIQVVVVMISHHIIIRTKSAAMGKYWTRQVTDKIVVETQPTTPL